MFEIEGIFRGVAVVGVAVDDAHEHSLGDLTQKEVFSVHAHAPRRYYACLDEPASDGIFFLMIAEEFVPGRIRTQENSYPK